MKTTKPQQVEPIKAKPHRKNTIFDVYKYMNQGEYQVMKYVGTKLLQSFIYLGYEFEVRLSKDERTVFICTNSLIYSRTTSADKVIEELEKDEKWYLKLNWTDADELLAWDMEYKKEFLTAYLQNKHPLSGSNTL